MYNTSIPPQSELPSSKKLLRSTLIALIVAIAILVTIVMPSEYAIDPTGIGRALGLTEMGQIKKQLAQEAAIDAAKDAAAAAGGTTADPTPAPTLATESAASAAPAATNDWRDEMKLVLAPGEGAEIKLSMNAAQRAQFNWSAQGGVVNFDMHGEGSGQSISYEKGRGVPSAEGVLEAAFDGHHGWFWRNRGEAAVTVTVRARGQYAEMKRM